MYKVSFNHGKDKCQEQYIGEKEKTLSVRFRQHRGYVRNKEVEKSTWAPNGRHENNCFRKTQIKRCPIKEN